MITVQCPAWSENETVDSRNHLEFLKWKIFDDTNVFSQYSETSILNFISNFVSLYVLSPGINWKQFLQSITMNKTNFYCTNTAKNIDIETVI